MILCQETLSGLESKIKNYAALKTGSRKTYFPFSVHLEHPISTPFCLHDCFGKKIQIHPVVLKQCIHFARNFRIILHDCEKKQSFCRILQKSCKISFCSAKLLQERHSSCKIQMHFPCKRCINRKTCFFFGKYQYKNPLLLFLAG